MIHISIARSGVGYMARNVDLQISDRVRLLFHHSILHKIKSSYRNPRKLSPVIGNLHSVTCSPQKSRAATV